VKPHRIAVISGDRTGLEVAPRVLPDLGGSATTAQVTDAVCALIEKAPIAAA
jgi:isocitrate/isopropylmalate dehydrogenase